jgi:hypothetical protein
MNQQSKHQHRDQLVRIGIDAVEHALRFLPRGNPTREIVEERLAALRSGEARQMIASIRRETEYTQESCIRRASNELLKLSVSEKWLSGQMLTGNVFVPCWDAGSFVGRGEEMDIESKWQDDNLYPQIETAFEKVRAFEKQSAA